MFKVYVLNSNGQPLMPCSLARADNFLKKGKAKVVSRCPFQIKMLKATKEYRQEIVAAIVPSSKEIGVAAKVKGQVETVYSAEVILRQDISAKMTARRIARRLRRSRKTRYRQPRFDNRKSDRKFNPTMRSKLEAHSREVKRVERLLPVTQWLTVRNSINAEVNDNWLNQQRKTFERDNFRCRHCKGKGKLHAHHVVFRSEGGTDDEENLVTLCETCHQDFHASKIQLKIGKSKYRGNLDTELAIIRKNFVVESQAKKTRTFGYLVKERLWKLELEHSPQNCACAALQVKPGLNNLVVRCIAKGSYQRVRGLDRKQMPKGKIQGFKTCDKVRYLGREYFIQGRYTTGYAELMDIYGKNQKVRPMAKFKSMTRLSARKSTLTYL